MTDTKKPHLLNPEDSNRSTSALAIEHALQSLPDEEREEIIGIIEMTQSYSGPIMPPKLMEKIEDIIPGGAERVLKLSEKEQAHRHLIVESRTITEEWQIKASLLGGLAAYAFLVAGILYCAANNYVSGTVALGGIGAFGVISHIIRLPRKDVTQEKSKK